MNVPSVGIVGGGPGGLMTAYGLQKLVDSPLRTTLFEAGSRLGGKILTGRFDSAPVRYEAGAAEFYDYSKFGDDPLKDLVAELGLPIRRMGGPAVVMEGRVLANLDDVRQRWGDQAARAWREFDRRAKDRITPGEFYAADDDAPFIAPPPADVPRFDVELNRIADPRTRRFIERLIHSDLAAEPHQTSVVYGLQNYLMNDSAYMDLYGIEGGNERLVQELAGRIAARVQLERRVVSVGRAGERLAVRSVDARGAYEDVFDFLVVSLPLEPLGRIEFQGERLSAAMRAHQSHFDHPAHYLRITLLFDRPFWRDVVDDSYWMLDAFDGCCLYDESSRQPGCRHGVLGWLLGGDAALAAASASDESLVAQALDSLPDFLSRGRACYREGRVHRWIGAVNAIPGGLSPVPLDRRHRPEPIEHPGLFLTGDYLFDSTLNGVLDSADYASAWIAALIAEAPQGAS